MNTHLASSPDVQKFLQWANENGYPAWVLGKTAQDEWAAFARVSDGVRTSVRIVAATKGYGTQGHDRTVEDARRIWGVWVECGHELKAWSSKVDEERMKGKKS